MNKFNVTCFNVNFVKLKWFFVWMHLPACREKQGLLFSSNLLLLMQEELN